jgi:hypothetical protein
LTEDPKPIEPVRQTAESLGGCETLTTKDIDDLRAGTRRVSALMSDMDWHSPEEIRWAAGSKGQPATEGLRRLRELRAVIGVEVEKRRRPGTRFWEYRIVYKDTVPTPKKVHERQHTLF